MELNELTGLPELPQENLYFEVNEVTWSDNYAMMFSFRKRDQPGAYIAIMEKIEITTVHNRDLRFFGIKIKRKPGERTEIKAFERERLPIVKIEVTHENVYGPDDDLIGVRDKDVKVPVPGHDLTPALIAEHAVLLLNLYNQRQISLSYLGEYPPKKLVGE
jgi:hypothetical protein